MHNYIRFAIGGFQEVVKRAIKVMSLIKREVLTCSPHIHIIKSFADKEISPRYTNIRKGWLQQHGMKWDRFCYHLRDAEMGHEYCSINNNEAIEEITIYGSLAWHKKGGDHKTYLSSDLQAFLWTLVKTPLPPNNYQLYSAQLYHGGKVRCSGRGQYSFFGASFSDLFTVFLTLFLFSFLS